MPLFESQSSRNDRMFGGMQYAVHKIIREEFGEEPEAATHLAWVEGGMRLARFGVEYLTTLKRAWGKGSLETTYSLTKVFALNMISRWYRAIRGDRPIKDETRAVQIAATNILRLLGEEALGDIVDFINLHIQFVYECDWLDTERVGVVTWSYQLLMDKALVACGEAPAIDWRIQAFPVEKHDDLKWLPGRHLPDTVVADFPVWLAMVTDAQEKMFKVYEACAARGSG